MYFNYFFNIKINIYLYNKTNLKYIVRIINIQLKFYKCPFFKAFMSFVYNNIVKLQ